MKGSYLNKKKADQATTNKFAELLAPLQQDFFGTYLCDPNANESCPKKDCVMLGGNCFYTKDRDCALPDRGTVEMLTPERLMQMQMLVRGSRLSGLSVIYPEVTK